VQISGVAIPDKPLSVIGLALFLIPELVGWAPPDQSAFWMEGVLSEDFAVQVQSIGRGLVRQVADADSPAPAMIQQRSVFAEVYSPLLSGLEMERPRRSNVRLGSLSECVGGGAFRSGQRNGERNAPL
jgi:hypothetical protein